jgi:carboxy-terminal domain RNA polymerase II polypeptide A small phosphatase
MQEYYEVIIYTASLQKYADPLMDILDDTAKCSGRLFREQCTFYQGMYVKDLSELGRDMRDVLIIDNSPTAYLFQPDNALPIISWYDDFSDRCLFEYVPFLIQLSQVEDVRPVLKQLNAVSMENDVNLEYGH